MKTSWIIGCVMAYLLIFSLEVFATGGTSMTTNTPSGVSNVVSTNQTALMTPMIQEGTSAFSAAWAVITGLADYLKIFLGILVLWSPTVFEGYGFWVWYFICLPIDIGMVFSIVSIARGVQSS